MDHRDGPDAISKYRGKCVLILIIDTGLFLFDLARTAYFIILEIVTTAAGGHVKLHNQQLSSLFKNTSTYDSNYTVAAAASSSSHDSAIMDSSSRSSGGTDGLTPSTTILQNAKKLVRQASTTIASTILRQSTRHDLHSEVLSNNSNSPFASALVAAPADAIPELWNATASKINFHEDKDPSERDKIIIGYLCSIVIIIIQIWACTTLWKACQPEIHPRLATKCCRKYCNYTLFPRIPLVLFKWSIPGVIFLPGETTVVCIFAISYCIVSYHWVSEFGKELVEITSGSSTIANVSASTTAAWQQNNIAFVNSVGNPDGDLDLHHIRESASIALNMNGGTTTTTTTTTTGGGGSYSLTEDDEETYRPPQHEIPKHERIGYR